MSTETAAPTSADLVARSLAVLRSGQSPTGAFIASPDFAPYRFGWVRDGTFCAYALDRWGHHGEAARFHRWVGTALAVHARSSGANRADRVGDGFPPTRFTLDGRAAGDEWPNFQLDGYGAWLWGLGEHARLTDDPTMWEELAEPVATLCHQLEGRWRQPCFDCWEESQERVHTSTLACLGAGLRAAGVSTNRTAAVRAADDIDQFLTTHAVHEGRFVKSIGSRALDASLLWLSVPFAPAGVAEPVARRTADAVWAELGAPGVRRYDGDRYFGGGAWPLLTAWYGWVCAVDGRHDEARRCLRWIEQQAGGDGSLPEQVGGQQRDPSAFDDWVRRVGPPARQLLWSHAMHLVLADELGRPPAPPRPRPVSDSIGTQDREGPIE